VRNWNTIQLKHRAIFSPQPDEIPSVWNVDTFKAGLRTQNYDKGLDRFVAKFDPNIPMAAVIAIEKGRHSDHGTAIYFTQEKRRCLLLDTLYGLSDEEALWYTLQ
jgi:hypothetical protein